MHVLGKLFLTHRRNSVPFAAPITLAEEVIGLELARLDVFARIAMQRRCANRETPLSKIGERLPQSLVKVAGCPDQVKWVGVDADLMPHRANLAKHFPRGRRIVEVLIERMAM